MGQNYATHRRLRPLQSFYNSYNRQAEFQVPPHAVFLPCSSAVFEVLLERWSFRQSGYQEKHPARHLFSVPLALPFLEVPSPLQDLQGLKQAKERIRARFETQQTQRRIRGKQTPRYIRQSPITASSGIKQRMDSS